MSIRILSITVAVNLIALTTSLSATTINLDAVIGSPGTLAVGTVGGQVNKTGAASNSGTTSLDQAATVSFNFNSFPDTQDRATGFASNGGTYADRKYNNSSPTALVLDTNNNAVFPDETDQAPSDSSTFHLGFGMHADQYITFDLNAIRTANSIPGAGFILAGSAGVANIHPLAHGGALTSAAILLDGVLLAVYDFNDDVTGISGASATPGGNYYQYDTYIFNIPSSGQYLTFVGLSGLDLDVAAAHVGFGDVTLTAVPECSSLTSLAIGSALIGLIQRRRYKR
jgi:hypothetical protein